MNPDSCPNPSLINLTRRIYLSPGTTQKLRCEAGECVKFCWTLFIENMKTSPNVSHLQNFLNHR